METLAVARELEPGTMLDDKYRIDRLLAVGGMGAVYVGTHVKLSKTVAIKVLNRQLANPAMIERFHREAVVASKIGHEGIAQVTDLGTSSDGEPFLVMEYLDGQSLAQRLRSVGLMSIELACELGCAILSPLAAAHRAGIIHRDLKPDNVFLCRQSRGEIVKLLDFGISRAVGTDDELRLTNTGVVMGTPYYMSPEQARGDSTITTATDIYAFGVILYEMVCGRMPINADNYNQLMYRVMAGDYAPPRMHRPEIPEELEQLVLQAMARDAAHRPQSAAELEHMLLAFCRPTYREHVLDRISGAAIPFGTPGPFRPSQPPPPAMGGTEPQLMRPTGTDPRARAPLYIGGAMLAIGIAIAAAVVGSAGSSSAPSTAAAPAVATPAPAPAPVPAPAPAPAPAPVATSITLHFAIEPTSATITIDGNPVTGTEQTVTKDAAPHQLAISAPGFATHTEDVHFDENQKLVIKLDKAKATAAETPIRRPKPRAGATTDRIESKSPYDP